MNKLVVVIFASLLFLASCNTLKTIKLMKSGSVEQEEFNVEIPFEYRLGLIILKVNIADKEYDFILDTGAPNVISKKLAKELGLSNVSEQIVGDSQGNDADLGFISIEKLGIGGVNFLNTGAAVADFSLSKEIPCLEIDGFIGANLMRNAIWKFDYEKQLITITNSIESLNIPESIDKIPFFAEITGSPVIDIKLNDMTVKNVIVDLGSNGDILLSKKTLNKLIEKSPSTPRVRSFGISESGLYGEGEMDSIYYALIPTIALGDVVIENTMVSFTNNSEVTVGNNFFKNYNLIFNWFDEEILLIKKKEYDYTGLSTFGFSYINQENKLIVGLLYEKSSAYNEGLKIGDQILKIGKVRYSTLSQKQWCEIVNNGLFGEVGDEVTITVLRDNSELNFTLKNKNLL